MVYGLRISYSQHFIKRKCFFLLGKTIFLKKARFYFSIKKNKKGKGEEGKKEKGERRGRGKREARGREAGREKRGRKGQEGQKKLL